MAVLVRTCQPGGPSRRPGDGRDEQVAPQSPTSLLVRLAAALLCQEPRQSLRVADRRTLVDRLIGTANSERRRKEGGCRAPLVAAGRDRQRGIFERVRTVTEPVSLLTEPTGPERGLWAQVREDWVAHGRDWTRAGFRAVAVYRFGVWRMGIRPKIV